MCYWHVCNFSLQTKISPVYSKAQTVKINFPYKGKSIAHCFDGIQLILAFGFQGWIQGEGAGGAHPPRGDLRPLSN